MFIDVVRIPVPLGKEEEESYQALRANKITSVPLLSLNL
jgi:hypothetical protein